MVRFQPDTMMTEEELRRFIAGRGFSMANMSYRYDTGDGAFEYAMVIRTRDGGGARILTEALRTNPRVQQFHLSPMAD
jgi:putative Mg2+ transporter-C (MgtC) family protein